MTHALAIEQVIRVAQGGPARLGATRSSVFGASKGQSAWQEAEHQKKIAKGLVGLKERPPVRTLESNSARPIA